MNWGNSNFGNNEDKEKMIPQMWNLQSFPSISYYSFPNMTQFSNYTFPPQQLVPVFPPPSIVQQPFIEPPVEDERE